MRAQSGDPLEGRKQKSRIVSFRVDEDDFARLDALARHTSCSPRGQVIRRCLRGARLDERIGGLLKLAIRDGVSDGSSYHRLNLELIDSVIDVRRALNRLAAPL